MTKFKGCSSRSILAIAICSCLSLGAAAVSAEEVTIIQPGAPGEPIRELTAEEAIQVAVTSYSPDDVRFMQDMIPHHHQALQMAELVSERTNTPEIVDLAGRINASQKDEIQFMQDWLRERGKNVPNPEHHHHMQMDHKMAGMATPEQMEALAESESIAFDRLFLELMIAHHEGAVTMVEELQEQPGSAYDPVLFEFISDVTNDQTAEVERMGKLLAGLSDDPRATLAAGYHDAGAAILNLNHEGLLPKPAGFFDPDNIAGLPPEMPSEDENEGEQKVATGQSEDEDPEKEWERSPFMDFANTDIAFSGDVMVAGSYHGFNIYRLQDNDLPQQLSSVVCPGGQGDVSVVGDLLIMSVEQTRARLDCGLQGVSEDVSPERFRGLRIFDISDLKRPIQVGAVQTCRGSHTHSVVSGPDEGGKIIVYNSGTAPIRDAEEMPACVDDTPGDNRTALFRIDVIEIPVAEPSKARIVDSPAVFADTESGVVAGLWRGGDHGDDTQETNRTDHCHDITVYPERKIAAGACSGNGILFDISDPLKPQRIDAVKDAGFAYWHSATFNNDGTKVIFTDEWGGGGRPRCRAHDPLDWGGNAIYDIVDGKLEFRSHYKLPAPQSEQENCVAHNGSIVPVPGRDIFVQAWYQGGLSLMDFTDSANPVEIGYFDRGPIDEEHMVLGGYWSVYWYNGKLYGTEIARGIDVFSLQPSQYLTANEVGAAGVADMGDLFNPQQQFPVRWPAKPVVAKAYLDQLSRRDAIPETMAAELYQALESSDSLLEQQIKDKKVAGKLIMLASLARLSNEDEQVEEKTRVFTESLKEIARDLR
ncbi:DUF305 domain-containing protein [Microbulbifer flavimaris]|uniref:DUF305 domain-containing protein n=1 Tax=Microbulbifer flavimaris TaxID=1781068 RepID=A0ABX4I1H7_9GAMM|nr:DUF305 domain-containing protein [Microbulbifer sp. ZGT114]PCO06270.1 DUF305 domain-containing protein [Microbulbifer flavimaris]